jgi:Protein of unknown function (DUF5672)
VAGDQSADDPAVHYRGHHRRGLAGRFKDFIRSSMLSGGKLGDIKLDLRDVTLCAADSANVSLTARALRLSMTQCDFADTILFSHAPVAGPFRTVEIGRLNSTPAYSTFVFKQLPALVETPYVLIVQWDGYIVDPTAWRSDFRKYDYIGARWLGETNRESVGNGGFSLRSRKFMVALAEPRFALDDTVNSDWQVCHALRPVLERDCGIRFATEAVADRFSYETIEPLAPTFGFHGMGNMWRHVDDAEMVQLVDDLAPYVTRTVQCARLLRMYFVQKRLDPLRALFGKMKTHIGSDGVRELIVKATGDDALALACVGFCVALSMR